MKACCKPILLGWFIPERGLVTLADRHTGPFCLGTMDVLSRTAWYVTGQHVRLGNVPAPLDRVAA
jgi:hypothetical protein